MPRLPSSTDPTLIVDEMHDGATSAFVNAKFPAQTTVATLRLRRLSTAAFSAANEESQFDVNGVLLWRLKFATARFGIVAFRVRTRSSPLIRSELR